MDSGTKRCRYCGGTLWQEEGALKCVMCSRPAEVRIVGDVTMARPRLPKLLSDQEKLVPRRHR